MICISVYRLADNVAQVAVNYTSPLDGGRGTESRYDRFQVDVGDCAGARDVVAQVARQLLERDSRRSAPA